MEKENLSNIIIDNKKDDFRTKIYLFNKRLIDILLSSLGILILLPCLLLVFIEYKVINKEKGSIFFKQKRFGLNGNSFNIYKFRSMVVNADKKLKLNPYLYQKYIDNNYKLCPNDDPRITKFGLFIRKTSIDELPQFINVIKGDMSIVGPRPVVKEELSEYNRIKLLSVRPGIMGAWQAKGRSNIGYPERAQIEMNYIDNASSFTDLKILVQNIIIIFKKDGAY
ncbi:sugar transferase [Apilactobacillus timberlakei]|uniref:sugar transferase n=1 Tax=Apilactobacillus timberlakei TaxID=2008380 RepID=UPI00112CC30A|nr:sugar transferase [Apilactobacillus timberlakei]TPR14823.1 sugar transferase [Apilactobacillus timberlakei]